MKNLSVLLVVVLCLAACAQDAHSWSYSWSWSWNPGSAPSPGGPDTPPPFPKWLQPPTADEVAQCRAAHEFTKWKACKVERFERAINGTFAPGPVCCSYIAGIISGCYSKFPQEFQERIYPKAFCSQYH